MNVARRLLAQLRPHAWAAAGAAALGAGALASGVALMATSAWLIASAALHPPVATLQLAIVGVRASGLARGLLRYAERLGAHDVSLRLMAGLRAFFFQALVPLAPARLRDARSGDLLARLVADVETLENVYVRLVGPLAQALLVAALVALLLGTRDVALTAVALAGLALAGAGLPWALARAGRAAGERLVVRRGELHARLVDGLQGLPELVAFGRADAQVDEIVASARAVAAARERLAAGAAAGLAAGGLVADLTALAVLGAALPLAHAGALPGVQLAVVALGTLAAFEAVAGLPAAFHGLGATRAAGRRLFDVIDAPPAVVDPPSPAVVGAGFELEVRGLSFAYEGVQVLHDVSLALRPGRCVALVGPSGAGKSTLLQLLLRFWDVPPGALWLNGRDVRELASDDVRARFALVPQRAGLLSASVRENLQLGAPGAGDDALRDALSRVGLADWAAALPEGLDTWVGEHGVRLSGGQRQRLALARALLSARPCLLLDEPTAYLDALGERALLNEAVGRRGPRAVLLVTHRLVGLEVADEVVVLDRGRVVERGTHAALAPAGGPFARLLARQRSDGALAPPASPADLQT